MTLILIIAGVVLLAVVSNESSKKKHQQRALARDVIKRIPALLEEKTDRSPWYELDDVYREYVVDIKCISCEIDATWACNAIGETEFADLHYKDGKIRVTYGSTCLFYGEPIMLLGYQYSGNTYQVGKDRIPPAGTWAYSAYKQHEKMQTQNDRP